MLRAKNLCGAIRHASAAILVHASSGRNVADATAAEIAARVADTTAGTIVAIAAETVAEIEGAGGSIADRAAVATDTAITVITVADTRRNGVRN